MEAPRGVEPTGTNGRTRHTFRPACWVGSRPVVVSFVGWQGALFSCGHGNDTGEAFGCSRPLSGSRTATIGIGRVAGSVAGRSRLGVGRYIGFAVVMAQVRRPVPFRTRKLRPGRGDGTALERVWESSTPPHSTSGFPSSVTLREPPFFVCLPVSGGSPGVTLREPLFLFPHTGVSSAHWRFLDAGRTAGGMIPPSAGSFGTPEGPWAEGFLHPLGVLFRREAWWRADRSSHWESRDAGGSQEFQGSFLPLSDGGIDWGTMHYFVPKRCVESNKIMYRDKATARQAADQSWRERGTELWVYRCEFCGTWHLTHRDPALKGVANRCCSIF